MIYDDEDGDHDDWGCTWLWWWYCRLDLNQ